MNRAQIAAVAALDEPTRRRLYDHVVRQSGPVGRDEVAEATGVPRATVAFHLDKLVDEGLLEVSYERRTGRSGPGAGRPAKLYRRSERQISVSLPERQYELAALLLASSLEAAEESGSPARAVLGQQARALGAELRSGSTLETLETHGFEPRTEGDEIALGNCPFNRLAQAHPRLVCSMTLNLVDGMTDAGHHARLEHRPGFCCVRVGPDGA